MLTLFLMGNVASLASINNALEADFLSFLSCCRIVVIHYSVRLSCASLDMASTLTMRMLVADAE
jgi:hypothetical protein